MKYPINRALSILKAAALRYRDIGTRHISKICNKKVAIFDEDGCLFLEK